LPKEKRFDWIVSILYNQSGLYIYTDIINFHIIIYELSLILRTIKSQIINPFKIKYLEHGRNIEKSSIACYHHLDN